MNLAEKLIDTAPREVAGAKTPGRFDFQAHWGIGLMIDSHLSGGDYSVIFDYHDDLLWLNCSVEPDHVRFYQVKTKQTGQWSLTDLTKNKPKAEKGKPRSIAAKMVDNCRKFGDFAEAAILVSNAGCKDIPYDSTECRFSDAGGDLFEKMMAKLKKDYAEVSDAEGKLLWFYRTSLSLDDPESHSAGRFSKFLTSHVGQHAIASDSLYTIIFAECRRRSNSLEKPSTLSELIEHKGVTRDIFEGWLQAAVTAQHAPQWGYVQPQLTWPALEVRAIKREWNSFHPQALDPGNEAVRTARKIMREHLNAGSSTAMLCPLIEATELQVRPYIEAILGAITPARLRAMLLWEFHAP